MTEAFSSKIVEMERISERKINCFTFERWRFECYITALSLPTSLSLPLAPMFYHFNFWSFHVSFFLRMNTNSFGVQFVSCASNRKNHTAMRAKIRVQCLAIRRWLRGNVTRNIKKRPVELLPIEINEVGLIENGVS